MLSRLKGKRSPSHSHPTLPDDFDTSPTSGTARERGTTKSSSSRGLSPSPSPNRSAHSSTENLIDLTPAARKSSPTTSPNSSTRRVPPSAGASSSSSAAPSSGRISTPSSPTLGVGGRTMSLSPDRATRTRSASFNSAGTALSAGDRRSLNLTMPSDLTSKYLVVNGGGSNSNSTSNGKGTVGEGSLSFDLIGTTRDGRVTLVVDESSPIQPVEVFGEDQLVHLRSQKGGYASSGGESDDTDLKTPVPGSHPDGFTLPTQLPSSRMNGGGAVGGGGGEGNAGGATRGRPSTAGGEVAPNGLVSSSGTSPVRPSPSPMVRSTSSTSATSSHHQPTSTTSLPTTTTTGRPRSHTNASIASTSSLDPSSAASLPPSYPSNNNTSRPSSRSASINSQNNDFLSPTSNPSASSTASSRKSAMDSLANGVAKSFPLKKQRSNTGLSGIAGALALSGVALASPSAQLRQPIGLARVASGGSLNNAVVNPANATSTITAGRDSLDDSHSDSGGAPHSHSGYSSDAGGAANGRGQYGGFVSMDQLGDFEEMVNQLGTGYAVASSKRNHEFHQIFKHIPEDDYLIEDYGCALQREILIQGRLYISEHHLSFNANIFGWVTSLTLPFAEVVSIEKRMTAFVIPNAIQVTTLHASHTFASFLSRDTTYDLIGSIWRTIHPLVPASAALPDHASHDTDDEGDGMEGGTSIAGSTDDHHDPHQATTARRTSKKRWLGRRRGDTGESKEGGSSSHVVGAAGGQSGAAGGGGGAPNGGGGDRSTSGQGAKAAVHAVTTDTLPLLKNLKEVCMDTVFPSSPEKIYNLMFTSGFMREFWSENQKLLELQIGDWAPEKSGSNLLARSLSYIKPLNGSIGPKQTKCLITDESAHVDFDDYVCMITSTRTPDVPSGSAFAVKTRTSMTWAKGNSCRVVVTTGVEWSKSSFIKGIIERSCIDGQKTYHSDLEKAMRAYIQQHRSEFMEEGGAAEVQSLAESSNADDAISSSTGDAYSSDPASPTGARANDPTTLDRIMDFVKPIGEAFGGLGDMFGGVSPMSAGLGFVIAVLVLSNVWTLSKKPSTNSRSPLSPGTHASGANQRTPDEVATAVRSVLQDYFAGIPQAASPSPFDDGTLMEGQEEVLGRESILKEVQDLNAVLDTLEARVQRLRGALAELD